MFDSSRQDDLLNRLKSCVGGLKQENTVQSTLSKQSTSILKENQLQYKEAFTMNPLTPSQKIQNLGSLAYERKPMAAIVNQPLTSRRAPAVDSLNQKNKRPSEVILNTKQKYFKSNQESKLNDQLNRFKAGLNTFKNRQTQIPQQSNSFKLIQNNRQSQVKNSIARRYSFMQNQKAHNLLAEEPSYSYLRQNSMAQKPIQVAKHQPKKYREELQQRKNLIDHEFNALSEKPILSARKEVVSTNLRKENNYLSSQKQPLIQEKIIRNNYQPQSLPKKPLHNTSVIVNEKPVIRETLRMSLQTQEGECTALAKLKKISELNQKINERIRNIINVFEQQK